MPGAAIGSPPELVKIMKGILSLHFVPFQNDKKTMLDINFIRKNPAKVKTACTQKGLDSKVVDRLLKVDDQRRQLIADIQDLRQKRNQLIQHVSKKPDRKIIEQGKKLKNLLSRLEPDLNAIDEQYKNLMLQIPNIPKVDVPIGEKGKVVRTWGKKPKFKFKIKDHIELGESLNLLDLKRGSKVAGFRGYFLKNEAALMHLGLMDYALRKMIKKSFKPMAAPVVDKKQAFFASGHFPWGEKEAYTLSSKETEKVDRYLAGTAEVPLVYYHANEIFNEKDLPIKYVGFSPCFRREIGNYGKDTKGIYRIHEFLKIEQVVICKNSDKESEEWLEKLASFSEEMLQELKLPYRVVLMPTGDMGEPQAKKYDIDVWMPGRGDWGEMMSDSIMGDFQARRANLKYRAKGGETKFVHTLNNTAIATPRILIAIWENYQQKDGSIKVPKVLQKYVGKKVISNE